jgi:hypothetical protein
MSDIKNVGVAVWHMNCEIKGNKRGIRKGGFMKKLIFIAATLLMIFTIGLWATSAEDSLVSSLLVLRFHISSFFRDLLILFY